MARHNSGPSKQLHKVRLSIESLCEVLNVNGKRSIIPETIRKAKFNNETVVEPLWSLLYEMCMLVDNDILPTFRPDNPQIVGVVTDSMKIYGFQEWDIDYRMLNTKIGSQDLLLAFGWLLAKECLTDRIVLHALSSLPFDVQNFHVSSEHYEDNLHLESGDISLSDRLRHVVWLLGKCKMLLRNVFLLSQEHAVLIYKISKYTCGVSLSFYTQHLSALEVFILRHPQHLSKVQLILENINHKLGSYLKWKDHESVFWVWMKTVIDSNLNCTEKLNEMTALSPALSVSTMDHCTTEISSHALSLFHLNTKLKDSIKQLSLTVSNLDDQIEDLVANSHDPVKPSNDLNEMQQDLFVAQSRNMVPGSTFCQKFIYNTKKDKRHKKIYSERPLTTIDEKLNIKDEICRLELKVKEKKQMLHQHRIKHQDKLNNILVGANCICIPPLSERK